MARHMLDMCRDLGIACVAEGVETREQLHILQEMAAQPYRATCSAVPSPRMLLKNSPETLSVNKRGGILPSYCQEAVFPKDTIAFRRGAPRAGWEDFLCCEKPSLKP